MKYLKEFGIILLITKVIKLEDVKSAAQFLIAIMPVMFIPAAAGLINSWSELQPILIPALVTTVVSTFVVMAVTGITAQKIIRSSSKEEK